MRMPSRLTPLVARSRSRLGLSNDIRRGAIRTWEISPAVDPASLPAAVFDESDLALVTGVAPFGQTVEEELRIVRARGGRHGASTAYELRDAVLSGGHLFTREGWLRIGSGRVPAFATGPMQEFKRAALGSSDFGRRYFGHWMTDDLPLLMACAKLASPVTTLRRPTPTQRTLQALLVPGAEVATDAFFERLVVLDDIGQNAYKRERYLEIRARMAAAVPDVLAGPGVMLLRGATGERRIMANEQEVAASLEKRGWKVLDPQTADVTEIIRYSAGARIVLGVEGSQVANGMMCMPSGAALLEIQPPQRLSMTFKHYCDCVGSPYAFTVGRPLEGDAFRADIDSLHRLIDRLERRPV